MARHAAVVDRPGDNIDPDAQHRCMCCGGVIANFPEEAFSIGLDLKLGLVSDECALICNDCTAKLVEARRLQTGSASSR
jgi:hypothetical protein